MNRSVVGFVVGAVLAASSARAQAPAPTPATLTATRNMSVVVTDARGNRIHGLAQSDFQILDGSKAQEITGFREVARDAAAADVEPPRRVVLAFDMSTLSLAGRKKGVEAVRAFVASRVRSSDRVLVAEVSHAGVASTVSSWTSDPVEIGKALATVEGRSVTERSFSRRTTEQSIQMAVDFDRQTSGSSGVTFDSLMQSGRQYAAQARAEALRTADAIQDVIGMLGDGPGSKMVILCGGGLSTRPGSEIFTLLDGIKQQAEMGRTGPGVQRGARQANPRAEISHYSIDKDVRDIAAVARNRGVRVYALEADVTGTTQAPVERQGVSNDSADFAGVADQMSGYQALTSDTGGIAMIGGSPEDAVARLSADLDSHYALTFRQTVPAEGPIPRLEVRVAKPGARARYSFLGGPATKDSEVRDAVVANHRGEVASNDLQIAVAGDPPVTDADGTRVKLRVLIPVRSLKLVPQGDELAGSFAVYVATGDAKGNSGTVSRQQHSFHWTPDAASQMLDKTIGYAIEVVVPAGRTQISIGVLDQNSEQTGYARLAL